MYLDSTFLDLELSKFNKSWERLKEGADRIISIFPHLAGRSLVRVARDTVNSTVSRFIGDVFTYIDDRGTPEQPGLIVDVIIKALKEAKEKTRTGDEKLIVVAHSMGGNIVYDILTYFLPNFEIDVLVTVGSQVGFFEELKLFAISNSALPNAQIKQVAKLNNVKHWINVFDLNDVLSFVTEPIFEGTEDFNFSTGEGIFTSHTTYFLRPSFHSRLSERLQSAFAE